MKKLSLLLILVISVALCSCAGPKEEKELAIQTQSGENTANTQENIPVVYGKEEFIEEFDGIWVNMDTYNSLDFEFLSFDNGNICDGVYIGGAGRTGRIIDASKSGDIYTLKLHYPSEVFMGDFYEEEYIDWKIKIFDNCLTTLFEQNNTSWVYKGKTLDEAVRNMDS